MRIGITDNEEYMVLEFANEYERNIITTSLTAEIPNAYMLKKIKSIKNTERKFIDDYGLVPIGLWAYLIKTCKTCNLAVELDPKLSAYITQFHLDYNEFRKYVDDTFKGAKNEKGKPFKPYEYQIEAAYKLLKYKHCCGEISTSAGKTLISFIIFKYLIDVKKAKKILYVVPSVDLAEQSAEKYEQYESFLKKHNHNWEIGILRSRLTKKEKAKVESCNILFGTFQSLCKRNFEFFADFYACINDECLSGDTLITMSDGSQKKISEVKIGEKVITFNTNTYMEEIHEVEYVYHNLSKDNELYELECEYGEKVKITGNHKVFTMKRGWVRVDELFTTDSIQTRYGDYSDIMDIHCIGNCTEDVWNLRIKCDDEYNHNYFANGLCVSNCHHSSSSSIRNILTKCINLDYSIGVTGTFPKEGTHDNFVIQSYIGPLIYKFTADDLINKEKRGTPIYVTFQFLDWATLEEKKTLWIFRHNKNEEDPNAGSKLLRQEQTVVNNSYIRLKHIGDMACNTKKNTLVLFGQVKDGYGRKLYEYIKDNSEKTVFYVDGNTPSENREWMKEQMEEDVDGNTVMVASIGTMGEGIDLKNLWCIFLVNTTKSERIVRQICGRGLRQYEGKTKVVLIDFIDDLRYTEDGKQTNNYMYKHYLERRKIYTEQNFPVFSQKISFQNQLL